MDYNPNLHRILITCKPEEMEPIESLFGEEALAISTFAPPRETEAQVEVLVDGNPDATWLKKLLSNHPNYKVEPVGNLDWIKKVSEDFQPLPIARWTVFGAAHRDKITDPSTALQIDATSAFGTGEHPTTRGCLIILDQLLNRMGEQAHNWSMLDMGCGSGILAMAFAKALLNTKAKAYGMDMDQQSVEIANENADINGVANQIDFDISMGYDLPKVKENAPYDLIMANIFADPLCEMAPELKGHLKDNGHVILSGILNTQADTVIKAHTNEGLHLDQRIEDGEWSILEFSASNKAS